MIDSLWAAITSDALHVGIAILIAVLVVLFAYFVLLRAGILLFSLWSISRKINVITDTSSGSKSSGLAKRDLSRLFERGRLKACWAEYADTLHEQLGTSGVDPKVMAVRATVPAESFFNAELIVDGALHTEFFRHLPGIFTGLGIIATFSGLIAGLQGFDVMAVEPDALKASLGNLFGHVGSAFVLSAVAIGLAMFCTIIEKVLYAANVHAVSSIAITLDSLFKAGIGEEYLSKLVRSSEDSAVQTRQLKESLVDDLRVLLTNLTERQVEATRQLSADIGTNLEASLQVPLQRIAETVQVASRDQSNSASKMIESLMGSFMNQMQQVMGSQMGDLSKMMEQSAASIMRVEENLRRLVDDMQSASSASSDGMQRSVHELMASLASHERQQSESLGAAQVQMLAQIQSAVENMASAQAASATQVSDASTAAAQQITQASVDAQKQGEEATRRASDLVESIRDVSTDSIQKMEAGAMQIASMLAALGGVVDRLAHTGGTLAGIHEQSGLLGTRLEQSASMLRNSSDSLAIAAQSLSQTSIRVEGVSTLMMAEATARETAMREVQLALSKGQEAAREFASYSTLVSDKLGETMEQFGASTVLQLNRVMTDFDKELRGAVETLSGLVERMQLLAVHDQDEN